MKKTVKSFNPGQEFYTDEGCFITELYNSADDPHVSIGRARVRSGVTTRWGIGCGGSWSDILLSKEKGWCGKRIYLSGDLRFAVHNGLL
jgi:hypothetical protein